MKPIKMKISAFGPYAEQLEIPFEALGENGLFLITGDTGAGKTTIFDAVCFALFGDVSGSNREVDGLRSDFAKPETETFVQLDFLHRGNTYRIWRKPAYMRIKKRGEGVIKENADATFTHADGTVVTGARKVTQAIESLLGVDDRQFKQIAMIAQGEFLKLLYADSKERGDIFRRVFHTDLYRRFQDKLKQLEKEKKTLYEECGTRLQWYLGQCGVEESNQDMLYHVSELLTEIAAQINAQEQSCLALEKQLKEKEIILQQKNTNLEKAKQDNASIERLEEAKRQYAALQNLQEQRTTEKQRLGQQRRAVDYVQPTEQLWKKEQQQAADLKEMLQQLLQKQEGEKKHFEEKTKEKNEMESQKEELQVQKAQVLQMQKQLQDYQRRDAIAKQITEKEQELLTFQIKKQQNESSISEEEKALDVMKQQEGQLPVLEQRVQVLEQQLQQYQNRIADIAQVEQNQKIYIEKEKELRSLRTQYKVQNGKWTEAKQEADKAEKQYLMEQAGVLAENLTEGMPCPVCGSLHHPQKAVLSESAPTEETCNHLRNEEAKEKQKLEKLIGDGQKIGGICMQMQKEQETFLQKLGVASIEALTEDKQCLQQQVQSWKQEQTAVYTEKKKIVEILKKRNVLEQSLQQRKEKLEKLEEMIEQERKEKDVLLGEHQALCQRLGNDTLIQAEEALHKAEYKIIQKENQLQSIESAWQEAKENLTRVESRVSQTKEHLETQKKQAQQAKEQLVQTLQEQGFADFAVYEALLLPRKELEYAEKENQAYFAALEKNAALLHSREQDAIGREKQDIIQLQAELEQLLAEKSDIHKQRDGMYSQMDTKQRAFSEAQKYWNTRQAVEKEYLPILELSKTANGQQSVQGDKMTFEVFLQGFYFDRVVEAANLRFEKMTNGRFCLRRMETASDKRSQMGLELEVADFFTGKSRGVKSLSGGEAFQASLSLALGLSDMIQQTAGGIEIQSMFIDEGFGTLDEQSREQAIAMLQELTCGNRMVGIISHVTELKESIEKKLLIEKCNTGSTISCSL